MKTYFNYKGDKYEVIDFGERSDSYMKEFLCLNKIYVNANSETNRYTRIDLVNCTDFRQE